MATYGKRPINDAKNYPVGQGAGIGVGVTFRGEKRKERKPFGKIERFVDPGGHVMLIQLSTPGDPLAARTARAKREQMLIEGWVPHGECPLRHGAHQASREVAMEFLALPEDLRAPCASDPKTFERFAGETHAQESCPHVEWLIQDRQRRAEEELARNYPERAVQQRLEAEQRELHAAQLEVVRNQLAEVRGESKPKRAGRRTGPRYSPRTRDAGRESAKNRRDTMAINFGVLIPIDSTARRFNVAPFRAANGSPYGPTSQRWPKFGYFKNGDDVVNGLAIGSWSRLNPDAPNNPTYDHGYIEGYGWDPTGADGSPYEGAFYVMDQPMPAVGETIYNISMPIDGAPSNVGWQSGSEPGHGGHAPPSGPKYDWAQGYVSATLTNQMLAAKNYLASQYPGLTWLVVEVLDDNIAGRVSVGQCRFCFGSVVKEDTFDDCLAHIISHYPAGA